MFALRGAVSLFLSCWAPRRLASVAGRLSQECVHWRARNHIPLGDRLPSLASSNAESITFWMQTMLVGICRNPSCDLMAEIAVCRVHVLPLESFATHVPVGAGSGNSRLFTTHRHSHTFVQFLPSSTADHIATCHDTCKIDHSWCIPESTFNTHTGTLTD